MSFVSAQHSDAFPADDELLARATVDELLARAGFAVVDPSCKTYASHAGLGDFELVAHRRRILAPRGKKTFDLYLRKSGRVVPSAEPAPTDDAR